MIWVLDTCQMASLESFKGLSHPSDQDPRWKKSKQVLPKMDRRKNLFLKVLVGGLPQLRSWSDWRLELPSLLEEPSGNCQMTYIIQNLFQGIIFIFFLFFHLGGWVVENTNFFNPFLGQVGFKFKKRNNHFQNFPPTN